MMALQLVPPIPVWVQAKAGAWPTGYGVAILMTDYSQEHHKLWTVAFDNGGQLWDIPQPFVRLQANHSLLRGREAVISQAS